MTYSLCFWQIHYECVSASSEVYRLYIFDERGNHEEGTVTIDTERQIGEYKGIDAFLKAFEEDVCGEQAIVAAGQFLYNALFRDSGLESIWNAINSIPGNLIVVAVFFRRAEPFERMPLEILHNYSAFCFRSANREILRTFRKLKPESFSLPSAPKVLYLNYFQEGQSRPDDQERILKSCFENAKITMVSDFEDLKQKLKDEGPFDFFHLLAHGRNDGTSAQIYLREKGQGMWIDSERLAPLIAAGVKHLAFLCSCRTGPDRRTFFSGLAQKIASHEGPTIIISSRGFFPMKWSFLWVKSFYSSLKINGPFLAFSKARAALGEKKFNAWSYPVANIRPLPNLPMRPAKQRFLFMPSDAYYFSRLELEQKVFDLLEKHGTNSGVILTGLPGTGKSRIAAEVGRKLSEKKRVYYYDFHHCDQVSDDFGVLHECCLASRPLIILDNLPDFESEPIGELIVRFAECGNLLITSRSRKQSLGQMDSVQITDLSESECQRFIREYPCINDRMSLNFNIDNKFLFRCLGGNVSAIEIVCHLIKDGAVDCDEIIRFFSSENLAKLSRQNQKNAKQLADWLEQLHDYVTSQLLYNTTGESLILFLSILPAIDENFAQKLAYCDDIEELIRFEICSYENGAYKMRKPFNIYGYWRLSKQRRGGALIKEKLLIRYADYYEKGFKSDNLLCIFSVGRLLDHSHPSLEMQLELVCKCIDYFEMNPDYESELRWLEYILSSENSPPLQKVLCYLEYALINWRIGNKSLAKEIIETALLVKITQCLEFMSGVFENFSAKFISAECPDYGQKLLEKSAWSKGVSRNPFSQSLLHEFKKGYH